MTTCIHNESLKQTQQNTLDTLNIYLPYLLLNTTLIKTT